MNFIKFIEYRYSMIFVSIIQLNEFYYSSSSGTRWVTVFWSLTLMTVARCSYSVDQRPWCLTAVSFFTQRNFNRHYRDFSIWRSFNSSRNYAMPISLKCSLKRIRNKKTKFSLLFVFSLRQKVPSFRSAKGHSEFKEKFIKRW